MGNKNSKTDGRLGGYILVVLGTFFLLSKFITWLTFDLLWPLVLIGIGIHIITRNNDAENRSNIQKDGEKRDEN